MCHAKTSEAAWGNRWPLPPAEQYAHILQRPACDARVHEWLQVSNVGQAASNGLHAAVIGATLIAWDFSRPVQTFGTFLNIAHPTQTDKTPCIQHRHFRRGNCGANNGGGRSRGWQVWRLLPPSYS